MNSMGTFVGLNFMPWVHLVGNRRGLGLHQPTLIYKEFGFLYTCCMWAA